MLTRSIFLLIKFLPFLLFISCSSGSRGLSEKEKKAEILYDHGTDQLLAKNYTEALSLLIESNNLNPDQSKTLNNLAMAYYFKGAHEQAGLYLKKSLDIDPKNSDARTNLASILYEQGKLKEAEIEYQNVLKDLVYTKQFRTYYNLGLIKLRQGKLVEARQLFETSVRENHNYCPAHFELGRQEFIFGNYKNALKKFNDAIQGTCYNEATSHFYLGLTYLELKEHKKAQDKFNEIVSKFPQDEIAPKASAQLKKLEKFFPGQGSATEDNVIDRKAAPLRKEVEIGESPEF